MIQVGARSMQNFEMLQRTRQTGEAHPHQAGLANTIKELLMAAEYVASSGNTQVMLCERGIRTFETATRNTLDLSAVSVLHEKDAPAGDRRPQPRDGRRPLREAHGGCGRGLRRGRAPDRSPQQPRGRALRRRAVAHPEEFAETAALVRAVRGAVSSVGAHDAPLTEAACDRSGLPHVRAAS